MFVLGEDLLNIEEVGGAPKFLESWVYCVHKALSRVVVEKKMVLTPWGCV